MCSASTCGRPGDAASNAVALVAAATASKFCFLDPMGPVLVIMLLRHAPLISSEKSTKNKGLDSDR